MIRNVLFLLCFLVVIGCKKDDDVIACFGYYTTEVTPGEVQFTNCSENAATFYWDFGDGQSSTEREPKHVFGGNFPYQVQLKAGKGGKYNTVSRQVPGEIMVYKPNIYIYPEKAIDLCVHIGFPMGGSIVESIPRYGSGWCVNVEPSGRIDKAYDYLFYESRQPDVFQYRQGWCVARADLKAFFERNMTAYNFSRAEVEDFTRYWIPKLTESSYYLIYPQTAEIINKVIQLDFSVKPASVNRLFYAISETATSTGIAEPVVEKFNRRGFHVVEWGVIIK